MTSTVIVAGARTPIGKLLGGLKNVSAPELGGHAISAAVERSGVDPATIDSVIFGNVVQAGVGPNPARQSALNGGLAMNIPATTVNKLCLSGMTAVAYADQAIRSGYSTTIVAGGTESMTNAPHVARGVRKGSAYGATILEDALDRDALLCAIDNELMGTATERYQQRFGFTRSQLDEFAAGSHEKAFAATESGLFSDEIVTITTKKGDIVDRDEGIRPGTTVESLARLRPAFSPDGVVTAGTSSQLSDGACALVLMSKSEAQSRGIEWLAEIVSYGSVAGPDPSLLLQPAGAINDALRRSNGIGREDLAAIEINEAFAGVALASTLDLGVDPSIVNPNGGAIALGHPVGMSGARLLLTLALHLKRTDATYGAAALCGGGGQGDAMIIKVS